MLSLVLRCGGTCQAYNRGVAQSGSASALGAEGRWFESSLPDQALQATRATRGSSSVGRASAFQAECRGFESRLPLQKAAFWAALFSGRQFCDFSKSAKLSLAQFGLSCARSSVDRAAAF